ncbi:MBL fold metallo-hydrolase [Haematospirillum sp. H1815]|uniref:MBL fold metallo-hydrolase n=1 Tax=Haematospirillum sp. H1815 TaxID=2723108 RepID=UPI00143B72D1|nr:MBL fold metallo-hydrolase [Haematospirillum sp. H1815]NKD76457.1 MBL fold metallo-hydrolase [Haematospirillum sp. H1815]
MKVTVLGCGVSSGVPSLESGWGACDPANPRNRRSRASILIEEKGYRLLVDTSPDLRCQLLDAGITRLDGVLYTHAHADHTHGIDDLRGINRNIDGPLPTWADDATFTHIQSCFSYAFEGIPPGQPIFRPWLQRHPFQDQFMAGPLLVRSFVQDHGYSLSQGIRIGSFAYSTDVVRLSDQAFSILEGVDTWIIGVFSDHEHPTHAHVDLALSWIERVRPRRAVFTHMGNRLDYDVLKSSLPAGVEPAWDGMVLDIPDSEKAPPFG